MKKLIIDSMSELNDIEIIDNLGFINDTDWGVKAIKATQVWDKTMGEGVKIATIDTGIDMSHPDLKDKVKSVFNMVDRDYNVIDEYGHGSAVAGILVGDITGVAPKADIYAIKVLDGNGMGRIADVMDGITHAMNLGVDILCISLGTPNGIPLILKQRIVQAYESGLTIVCAVGNSGASEPLYPAFMDEVIAVGGLDKDFNVASFSNGGYDVLAPSVNILSTYKDGNYARMTGTSMASPLVAGGIALLISHYRKQGKELTPTEIKNMVKGLDNYIFDLTKLI